MIKSHQQFLKANEELKKRKTFVESEEKRFKELGLNHQQVNAAIEPLISFNKGLEEEILEYTHAVLGKFPSSFTLAGLGRMLILYRIYKNVSISELAEKLNLASSQVSRDEKNEYHGSSIEKISKVIEALDMNIKITIE